MMKNNFIVFIFSCFIFSASAFVGPLHEAVKVGKIERVKTLLADGADVNEIDEYNNTPLSLATDKKEIAALLIKHGAKYRCSDCKKFLTQKQQCSRCKEAFYCSQDCQKRDWPTHKIRCSSPSLIVLQGEVGFSKSNTGQIESMIKTSIPYSCTVLTLHHAKSKVAVLAHIDDYSSVKHLFHKIEQVLRTRFNLNLKSDLFVAHYMGGNQNKFSQMQQEAIINAIEAQSNVVVNKIVLAAEESQKPQIMINPANGELIFLKNGAANQMLELLQLCEYGDFSKIFLNKHYGDLSGDRIPYFQVKEANRHEADLPRRPSTTGLFDCESELNLLLRLEQSKLIDVKTDFERTEDR